MATSEEQLKRIQDKLQQLLKHFAGLQKQNLQLREELNGCREQVAGQKKTLDELKQQVSILKMGAGEMNEADKKEFEKRINSYVREIDRCIALISE